MNDLDKIIAFIREADKLKQVLRKTKIMNGERHENSAEHSWHLTLMALILAQYAEKPVDIGHVLKMLVVHDLAEIIVGDFFVYDPGRIANQEKEMAAAKNLFEELPKPMGAELFDLWKEFEEGQTKEACFARAMDRLQPVLCNIANGGGSWRELGITYEMAYKKTEGEIAKASPSLWSYIQTELHRVRDAGYFGN